MTSKPKSGRALCLSVAHCSHPDLDPTDKALLLYLAVNADYGTGGNSRPGNPSLCDATTLKRSALNDRLEKNIQRELIERTTVGDGRGKASAYRIRIEGSFFPDVTPTGEWLIEKVSGSSRTDSENKASSSGRTDLTKTVRQSQVNRPAESEKLSGQPAETVRKLPEDTQPASPPHTKPTNPSTETSGELPKWVVGRFVEFNKTALSLLKDDRLKFSAAIRQHGEKAVEMAWQRFVTTGTYNAATKFPAYLFFKDDAADHYIRAAIQEMQSSSWKMKHDPKYAAEVEAYILEQQQANWKYMTTAPPPENGGSVNEYLTAIELEELTAASNNGV